ncbi:MAG: sulfatase [Myxococcota bacterium]
MAWLTPLLLGAVVGCGTRDGNESPRWDIVVFVLDAARADHFGSYGYDRNTTPNIDALARGGVVYEAVFSEGASTYPSTAALMTGRSPGESGLLKTQPIPTRYPTLAERARDAGYRTYAYSENPFITPTFSFDRGFSGFDAVFPHEVFARGQSAEHDFGTREGIRRALDWMAEEPSEPFFAYFHVLRPHNPYTPPPELLAQHAAGVDSAVYGSTETLLDIDRERRRATPEELAQIVALYDANLAYGDAIFGFLVDGMRSRSLIDEAVIVVLSDHGEAFLEHGRMLHTSTVFDEMIHVPAIVRFPVAGEGRRVSTPLQLHDLGNAIARLAEEPTDELVLGGGPAQTATDTILSWTIPEFGLAAVRTPTHKLVIEVGEDACALNPIALYDLTVDPGEHRALPTENDETVEALAGHFRDHGLRECEASPQSVEELDPRTAEQLRLLGYVDD